MGHIKITNKTGRHLVVILDTHEIHEKVYRVPDNETEPIPMTFGRNKEGRTTVKSTVLKINDDGD